MSRDVVRLLRADANPGELIWEAVAYGAPRAEFGWGHSIASATDCLAMVDLYDGDQRALPIVQGIAGIAEAERDRPVNPLPDPVGDSAGRRRRRVPPARRGRAARAGAGACCAAPSTPAATPTTCGRGSPASSATTCSRYGHGAIYTQKAFQLLDVLGWERADTVLPHLVPTIVYGTREDTLPYMRPFIEGARRRSTSPTLADDRPPTRRGDDDGRAARRAPRRRTRPGGAAARRRRRAAGRGRASTACSTSSSTP